MQVMSSAFNEGETIPAKYTEDGQNISPPLQWKGAPEGTKSFALIVDDPDAPSPKNPAAEPWVHWVIFNIPADVARLEAAIPQELELQKPPGAKQGKNSWPRDNVGYRGPAPPPGSGKHRYQFHVYALDAVLPLDAGVSKKELVEAMKGRVLAEGLLQGVYQREAKR